ncbi:MAG: methyltransferase family protein [Longimicrobiales bacterium]
MFIRHAVAILALPFVVTVVIPALLLRGSEPHVPLAARASGLVVMGIGAVLVAATIESFASRGHGTLAPWDPPRRLVVTGVYRYVRNPMISGVIMILVGQIAFFASTSIGVWAVTVFALNAIYIPLVEEKGLVRRFGLAYETYRRNVPRWLPRRSPWPGDAH